MERDRSPINDRRQTPSEGELYQVDDDDLPDELRTLFLKNRCNLCQVSLTSTTIAQQHYTGKMHVKAVRVWTFSAKRSSGNSDTHLFCKVCNLVFSSPATADSHYIGRKHKRAVLNQGDGNKLVLEEDPERRFGIGEGFKAPEPVIIPDTANVSCDVCHIFCPNEAGYQAHIAGSKHKKKLAVINGENDNGTSPMSLDSPAGSKLMQRIAKVDLNCCQTTFPDIVELVNHLRSLQHINTIIQNISAAVQPGLGDFGMDKEMPAFGAVL